MTEKEIKEKEKELEEKENNLKKEKEEFEKSKENYETKMIKEIKDTYEEQISNLKKEHNYEIKKIKSEEEEKSVRQIKALMSGRTLKEENNEETVEISFEEQALIDTKKILGIAKEEN